MAATTPLVHDHILIYSDALGHHSIPLESQGWWDWLCSERTRTFRFSSPQGHFTARRENKQGNPYWYGYKKNQGKLVKVYLGKSEDLSEQRLCDIAENITERARAGQRSTEASTREDLLPLKFVPPAPRPSLIPRPRLMAHVQTIQQQRLTLISAPPGSGKSSLLCMWYTTLSEAQVPVAWISLDQRDNDASRFWFTFISAVQRLFPSIGKDAPFSLYTSHPPTVEGLLTSLLHDLTSISQPFVVILDDYHLIEAQAIQQAFLFLLNYLPPQMHLVMGTRTDPPFPLARIRAQGLLTEIRAKDLRFTLEETIAFFRQSMVLDLPFDEIAELHSHTEGWIAGLQLAALALRDQEDPGRIIHAFNGDHAYIVEYLAEEVLHRLPDHLQQFLLSTSLLDRLTEPLCRSMLDQKEGSTTTLRELARMNLFLIPLDEHWYRYHALFSDFLRHQLFQMRPEDIPGLHLKAAVWYKQYGYFEDAIQHLLAAPDFPEAAHLLEQSCDTLMRRGEIATALRWLQMLPDEQIHTRPYLSLNYAAVLGSIEQVDLAELRLQDAERAIRALESQHSSTTDSLQSATHNATVLEIQELWAALAVTRASLTGFRGDVAQTIKLSHQARMQLAAGNNLYFQSVLSASLGIAYVRSGDLAEASQIFLEVAQTSEAAHHTHLSLVSVCIQALLLMEKGQLYQAAERYRQVIQQPDEEGGQQHVAVSMAYLGLGELHYYWNDLDIAERFLRRGLHTGQYWESMMTLVRGALFLTRIQQVRGRTEEAFAVLQDLEHQALQLRLPSIVTHVEAIRAILWLAQGEVEKAVHWARHCGLSIHEEIIYLNEFPYVVLAQVLLTMGEFESATTLLTRLLEQAEKDGRMRSVLDTLLTQAMLYQQRHQMVQAYQTLGRAIALAEPEDNIRVFVERGLPMRTLLSTATDTRAMDTSAAPLPSKYINALLNAIDQQYSTSEASHPQVSLTKMHTPTTPLTGREQDVLHLLALGLSTQQIATDLVISVSTVKWYLKQIYTKLDAHNRVQTIAQARKLHLL